MDGSTTRAFFLTASLAALVACPAIAAASGARQGVTPKPGEMVLLRDAHTRTAYRPAPPGVALIADPSPQREVGAALGTPAGMGELSDDDFANLGAGQTVQAGQTGTTTVERVTSTALGGAVGRLGASNGGIISGNQISGAMSGPLGAVGNTTGGIGDTVRGALSQFPMRAPAGGK